MNKFGVKNLLWIRIPKTILRKKVFGNLCITVKNTLN
jgi:hypothetical protein